ncbi:conserved hypothetical protein [Leishmania braziliensis MHOM/BR/75/M2904]|uniref:Uncharacterized protein n=2 Tax=Leishmania braziliensis TaxID=5660 RepID=A4HB51_LEIBR|nr:conserved hypothetical protein [Leishmania braziliensis MHOM/BR/75/M2904]KAI5686563.1 hypothetical protein MNV84_03204 [Leishmania braziliensis]CAJ2471577.1 unnamed protein product [Leishmania braziliensis]CAM38637.1 conserved hypothetical protein [Leishmania braziliensis MHOM/BR/75/M2904]SYZ65340.1 hypothetical_protein [Leishmania braziliensis MHOM/BR/75/M2904]
MLRLATLRFSTTACSGTGVPAAVGCTGSSGHHINSQQRVLQINSPMSLLRMCYRSIDITVKSRHARTFLKKQLMRQWAERSKETNPAKQRFYMDLAGSFLQALHTERNPKPGKIVNFQLSRQVAYEQKLAEREKSPRTRRVRHMPKEVTTQDH